MAASSSNNPVNLNINISLCRAYLLDNEMFWNRVKRLHIQWLGFPHYEEMAENFREALVGERCPERAERIYNGTMKYLLSFRDSNAEWGELLPAALLSTALPWALKSYAEIGIPDDVTRATFQDFARWVSAHSRYTGREGISEIPWIFYPFSQTIYELGRLQYAPVDCFLRFFIYRNRNTCEYIALAASGLDIDEEGYILGTHMRTAALAFTATLETSFMHVRGYPVDFRQGNVSGTPVTLSLKDWELALYPGAPILNIHIPAGKPLTPEAVDMSLERAARFFPNHRFALCCSWLLDANLAKFMPENANPVRFMRRFYKVPWYSDGEPTILRWCIHRNQTLNTLKEFTPNNWMQTAIKEHLLSGGQVFDTAGFIPLTR